MVIVYELIHPSKCTDKQIMQNITVPKFRAVRYTYDTYCIVVTYAYHDVGLVPYPPRNKHALHTTCILRRDMYIRTYICSARLRNLPGYATGRPLCNRVSRYAT